jgi:hypothetical protein
MVALTAPAQDMRRAPKGAAYSIPTPCRAPRSTKLNRAASCCLEVGTGPLSYKPSSPESHLEQQQVWCAHTEDFRISR